MKNALITGGSRGLGLALARRLAQEGWGLVIDAREPNALEGARSELAEKTNVIAIPGDVTDESHRKALAESARKLGGALSIMPVFLVPARNRPCWSIPWMFSNKCIGPT